MTRRRQAWISAINRADLTDNKLENERVCSRHFVSGQAAKQWDQCTYTCGKGDWFVEKKVHVLHSKLPTDYLLCSDKEGNRCCPMVDRLIRVLCPHKSLSICNTI